MKAAVLTAQSADVLTEKNRISSIDIMRGIVMVIMALDHARDFFHQGALGPSSYNPTDMATTTPVLFFTRIITHFCAPTFVFLAGTSIYLNAQRKSKKDLSFFLITRGLWLILLEVIVIRFSFVFNFYFDVIILQVIWVIGAAMVCMSLVVHFSYRAALFTGLTIVFFHNLTDRLQLDPSSGFYPFWTLFRQAGFINLSPDHGIFVIYPLLPWLGIMILGYCLGKVYTRSYNSEKRQQILRNLGLGAILLFIVFRFINGYGDPSPWSEQKDTLHSVMSFINVTKYPPSLLYTLMTLGPVLLVLSWMEKANLRYLNFFNAFGRVPLFYYILHFYILHAVSLLLFMNETGKSFSDIDLHFSKSFGGITSEGGYTLGWAYVAWIGVVLFLYPFCRWYNQYKSTHKHWWLSYL